MPHFVENVWNFGMPRVKHAAFIPGDSKTPREGRGGEGIHALIFAMQAQPEHFIRFETYELAIPLRREIGELSQEIPPSSCYSPPHFTTL